jgi:hypothetical protein
MSHLHWPTILLILLGLLLVTEAAASLAGHGLISTLYNSRTYHFIEVQPGVLYRDGMRNSLQFMRSVRRAGIHTVVDMQGEVKLGPMNYPRSRWWITRLMHAIARIFSTPASRSFPILKSTISSPTWPASALRSRIPATIGTSPTKPKKACRASSTWWE